MHSHARSAASVLRSHPASYPSGVQAAVRSRQLQRSLESDFHAASRPQVVSYSLPPSLVTPDYDLKGESLDLFPAVTSLQVAPVEVPAAARLHKQYEHVTPAAAPAAAPAPAPAQHAPALQPTACATAASPVRRSSAGSQAAALPARASAPQASSPLMQQQRQTHQQQHAGPAPVPVVSRTAMEPEPASQPRALPENAPVSQTSRSSQASPPANAPTSATDAARNEPARYAAKHMATLAAHTSPAFLSQPRVVCMPTARRAAPALPASSSTANASLGQLAPATASVTMSSLQQERYETLQRGYELMAAQIATLPSVSSPQGLVQAAKQQVRLSRAGVRFHARTLEEVMELGSTVSDEMLSLVELQRALNL